MQLVPRYGGAQELNLPLGGDVGYQVRYDKKVGNEPRIKFLTDGILLREIHADLLLRKYSVVGAYNRPLYKPRLSYFIFCYH